MPEVPKQIEIYRGGQQWQYHRPVHHARLFDMERIMSISIKPAYLDREAVATFISLSVPAMERLVASGVFPAPRQLTGKRVGWLVREVEEWAESRPVSSNLPVANCGMRQAA